MAHKLLNFKHCVVIDDLIENVVDRTGMSYNKVEQEFMNRYWYPESRPACFGLSTIEHRGESREKNWLYWTLRDILVYNNVDQLWITEDI